MDSAGESGPRLAPDSNVVGAPAAREDDEKTQTYGADGIARLAVSLEAERAGAVAAYAAPHAPPQSHQSKAEAANEGTAAAAAATVRPPTRQLSIDTEPRRRSLPRRAGRPVSLVLALVAVGGGLLVAGLYNRQVPSLARTQAATVGSTDLFGSGDPASSLHPNRAGTRARGSSESALVHLSIAATPSEARLALDGKPIANPLDVEQPADDLIHELVAEAPGCRTIRRQLRFDRSLTVVLELGSLPRDTVDAATPPAAAVATSEAAANAALKRPLTAPSSKALPRSSASAIPSPRHAPAQAHVDCSKPFTIDNDGIKTYKPGCL